MNRLFKEFVDDATEQAKSKLMAQGADKKWWDCRVAVDLVLLKGFYDRKDQQGAVDSIIDETYYHCNGYEYRT